MITLTTGGTLKGKAGTGSVITYTIYGDSKVSSANTYQVLGQGQLASSTGDLLSTTPVPAATSYLIKEVQFANTSASPVTGVVLYVNGSAASNQVTGGWTIPANGSATLDSTGVFRAYGSDGLLLSTIGGAAGGDLTGSYPNPTLGSGSASVLNSGTLPAGRLPALTGDVTTTVGTAATTLAAGSAAVLNSGTLPAGRLPALTGDVTTTVGTAATTLAAGSAAVLNSGTLPAGRLPALTGDVTTTVGTAATTLATGNAGNLNSGTLLAARLPALTGDVTSTVNTAATTLAAGSASVLNSGTLPGGRMPALTGDVTSTVNTVATTVSKINGTTLSGLATGLLKNTTGTGVPSIASSTTDYVPPARTLTTTAPLTIDATSSADLSANRTLAIGAASTSASGSMSAADKLKLDNIWIDVTATSLGTVTTAQTGAQNVTGINAILAAAPNGSTIYFPPGLYLFNAAWTMPQKMFTFQGRGSNRAGSPATAFTELQWNANVGGNFIAIASPNASLNYWYTTFYNLCFTSSATQSAGACIASQSNVGINIRECSFQGTSSTFTLFNCIDFTSAQSGGEGGNSTVVDGCNLSGFTGVGVTVNSPFSSVVITNSVMQGQWGSTVQCATACVRGRNVGALQIIGTDLIGAVNNVLLDPDNSASPVHVCASVFVTNVYMDNSFGSCVKISGSGATVRARFDTCSFTTSSASTAFSAVEIASTFAYAAGGQGLDFVNCNILNTFGTTGTTNGFLISGTADFSISNCRVAGWTNGIQVTPIATAGRTVIQISNNTIGASGGYNGNTTGILLNVGSANYGSVIIESNVLVGNTTAISDASVVNTNEQKYINSNAGLCAGKSLAAATGAIGATETLVLNSAVPAGSLRVGTTWKISGYFHRATSDGNPTTVRIKFGTAGTTADGNALVLGPVNHTAIAAQGGKFEAIVTCRAIGAGATSVSSNGYMQYFTNNVAATAVIGLWGTSSATALGALSSANAMFIGVSGVHATANTIVFDTCAIECISQ